MIGMPFQTRLLDLKFENDRVTCFGNRIVMNCFSFQPGSGQYMPNTSNPQNTPITCHHKFQPDECIWKSTLRCIAFRHFPNVTFIRLCLDPSFLYFFTPSPLMTSSSPNTKPQPLQGRCCWPSNSGSSDWSSLSMPRPEPGRRHMT